MEKDKVRFLGKKSKGSTLLEVCFTLPAVVCLMFFTIELMKINIVQDALQSMCEEATYFVISHDYGSGAEITERLSSIIKKYRPSFVPTASVKWYFETYSDLDNMLSAPPYGGTSVAYHPAATWVSGATKFIPTNDTECPPKPDNSIETNTFLNGGGLPNNRVFVLTFVCDYPFSSALVKSLFNSGSNTKIAVASGGSEPRACTSNPLGTAYILWARGAGIVNEK